jgi:hypothetical protein
MAFSPYIFFSPAKGGGARAAARRASHASHPLRSLLTSQTRFSRFSPASLLPADPQPFSLLTLLTASRPSHTAPIISNHAVSALGPSHERLARTRGRNRPGSMVGREVGRQLSEGLSRCERLRSTATQTRAPGDVLCLWWGGGHRYSSPCREARTGPQGHGSLHRSL